MRFSYRVFVVTLIYSLCNLTCYAQAHHLDSVKVAIEGFNTESIEDVSCEDFNYYFKKTKKIKVFRDVNDLTKFKLLTKHLKQTAKHSLDVRGTITYYYINKPVKYCFTVWGYFYNAGKFYYNKTLLIYISDKIYNNHPRYLDTLRQPWR